MLKSLRLNRLTTAQKIAIWTTILVVIDQIVKIMIHTHLQVGEKISVFPWFNLCYVENPGFAFGMQLGGDGGKIVLSLFRLVMIGAIIYGISKGNLKYDC